MASIPITDINRAIEKAQEYLRGEQLPDGAWHGKAIAGPDATAEILIAQRFLGALDASDATKATRGCSSSSFPTQSNGSNVARVKSILWADLP